MESPRQGLFARLMSLFGRRPDPSRQWPELDEPLPVFDLASGALGGLRFGDGIERAEFLGRPDRVENPGWTRLYYLRRGFQLYFEMSQLVALSCDIAPADGTSPEAGRGYARPRLSGGLELTPDTTDAQVRQWFGPPDTEDDDARHKTLVYPRGQYYMTFEFDRGTGRLLSWSATVDD